MTSDRAHSLRNRTLFITGASRGVGKAIALRAARDGANVAIVAKTREPHPKLPGTIFTAAGEIEAAGGRALPVALAEELRGDGIAVNALWPCTLIATAALAMLGGGVPARRFRTPDILGDAAHAILTHDSTACSGNFFLDEEVLRQEGVTDFRSYAVEPGEPLLPDLFVGDPDAWRGTP